MSALPSIKNSCKSSMTTITIEVKTKNRPKPRSLPAMLGRSRPHGRNSSRLPARFMIKYLTTTADLYGVVMKT